MRKNLRQLRSTQTKKATQRAAFSVIYLTDLLFRIDFYLQLVQLFLVDFARGAEHHIAALIVLWEGNAVANAVEAGKEAHKTVETVGETTVRGRTKLEGVHQEAELGLRLLGCEAQNLENLDRKSVV